MSCFKKLCEGAVLSLSEAACEGRAISRALNPVGDLPPCAFRLLLSTIFALQTIQPVGGLFGFMIQAILFDFNGVVIDDEPLHKQAYQEVLGAESVVVSDEDYYASLGMDDASFVRAAYARVGKELDDETLRRVIALEGESHRALLGDGDLPLFPGVVNFVKAAARKFPLGIVSMASREQIDYVLERATLKNFFSIIVSAEDERPCKPDPYCYQRGLDLLNERRAKDAVLPLRANECLVIEDSPPGVQSARAAGMHTLAVTNTVPERALRDARADVVTRSLADWTLDAVHHVFDKR